VGRYFIYHSLPLILYPAGNAEAAHQIFAKDIGTLMAGSLWF
jgi:hypothetical protein